MASYTKKDLNQQLPIRTMTAHYMGDTRMLPVNVTKTQQLHAKLTLPGTAVAQSVVSTQKPQQNQQALTYGTPQQAPTTKPYDVR